MGLIGVDHLVADGVDFVSSMLDFVLHGVHGILDLHMHVVTELELCIDCITYRRRISSKKPPRHYVAS